MRCQRTGSDRGGAAGAHTHVPVQGVDGPRQVAEGHPVQNGGGQAGDVHLHDSIVGEDLVDGGAEMAPGLHHQAADLAHG